MQQKPTGVNISHTGTHAKDGAITYTNGVSGSIGDREQQEITLTEP